MKKRTKGEVPVIGIRPIIDAREGILNIRASLENQTFEMANAVKVFLEKNVFRSSGEHVEVVVASHSIGRVAEAAFCAEEFRSRGVNITISVTPCWCYGSETMDSDRMTIKAVWGLNATERPGAVYLASVLAAYSRKGLPAFGIYGHDVQSPEIDGIPEDVGNMLLRFAKAAVAVIEMRGRSYLQIGAQCMGISGSLVDADFFEEYLGMRVESVDEVEVLRRIEKGIFDKAEYSKALEWTRRMCHEDFDKNPGPAQKSRSEKDHDWEFSVKCAMIIKDLMQGNDNLPKENTEEMLGHNAIAAGFQGQRQWTDIYPNTDFAEAILNTSFDWTGIREPYILATENDTLNGATMLLLKLLTCRAQMFADVRTCWTETALKKEYGYELQGRGKESKGFIHLINSGACCLDASGAVKDDDGNSVFKPFWCMTDSDIDSVMAAVSWAPADLAYFRGGGYSSRFMTRAEMPMTMARLNIVKGLGPVMQIVEGYSIILDEAVADKIWKRTDYTWPCTWFAPRITGKLPFVDAYSVMNAWGANHGAISYGHVGADLITLCSMLRIPVCMHNVDANDIFRPAVWNAFGMDPEGADYRACSAFGPMYR